MRFVILEFTISMLSLKQVLFFVTNLNSDSSQIYIIAYNKLSDFVHIVIILSIFLCLNLLYYLYTEISKK